MKSIFWEVWWDGYLRALQNGSLDAWLLTFLAGAILGLSGFQVAGGRSRWGVLALLNIAFAFLAAIGLATSVAYGVIEGSENILRLSDERRLAMMVTRALPHYLGYFYVSFWFLILLILTRMRRERSARHKKQDAEG